MQAAPQEHDAARTTSTTSTTPCDACRCAGTCPECVQVLAARAARFIHLRRAVETVIERWERHEVTGSPAIFDALRAGLGPVPTERFNHVQAKAELAEVESGPLDLRTICTAARELAEATRELDSVSGGDEEVRALVDDCAKVLRAEVAKHTTGG